MHKTDLELSYCHAMILSCYSVCFRLASLQITFSVSPELGVLVSPVDVGGGDGPPFHGGIMHEDVGVGIAVEKSWSPMDHASALVVDDLARLSPAQAQRSTQR